MHQSSEPSEIILVADLKIAPELQSSRDAVQWRVERKWDGVLKKEAMLLARKRM